MRNRGGSDGGEPKIGRAAREFGRARPMTAHRWASVKAGLGKHPMLRIFSNGSRRTSWSQDPTSWCGT